MEQDIRETPLYKEAEAIFRAVRQSKSGRISDAAEISTNGTQAVFAGALVEALEGTPPTRICLTELVSGDMRIVTSGPNTDRLPKFSPDGRQIAFLSDRHTAGDFQLYLLDPVSGAVKPTPSVEGWVEYLQWSPDGKRILLGVAGHGAEVAGAQGAVKTKQTAQNIPSWMPSTETTGEEDFRWRRVWVYEIVADRVRQVSPAESNPWETVWCGNDALAAVASPGPGEGLWYTAGLHIIEIATGKSTEVYASQNKSQLGWPAASPSGKHVAVVEAVCSDRGIVAGDLVIIENASNTVRRVDTQSVDITYTEWRSDQKLLLAGHRGFESVVGLYDVSAGTFVEVWSSRDITTGGRYIAVSGFNDNGDCALVGESFVRAPEIGVLRQGNYQTVMSFDVSYRDRVKSISAVECVSWKAPDGLEMQGWLVRPEGTGPHPLVMYVHGGPIWAWRPVWLGRASVFVMMLVERGYAVFYPNPRGSGGRGQSFARELSDGNDEAATQDLLSGLDYLVEQGIADPQRLGVTGGSYGGYMTSWLIGHDSRFAAAVPVAQVSNFLTMLFLSNFPHPAVFPQETFVKDLQHSPIMYAHQVKTPTLHISGALDRCTPPEEAMQFHSALLGNGVTSMLVIYPEEGHGIRKLPAAIDYTARLVGWFEKYMTA